MRLLYVFPAATAIVVAAVWALGAVDSWWVLVPAFLVYVVATTEVMRAVARAMTSGDEPEEDRRLLPH